MSNPRVGIIGIGQSELRAPRDDANYPDLVREAVALAIADAAPVRTARCGRLSPLSTHSKSLARDSGRSRRSNNATNNAALSKTQPPTIPKMAVIEVLPRRTASFDFVSCLRQR
jgi:hypothetical protein